MVIGSNSLCQFSTIVIPEVFAHLIQHMVSETVGEECVI